MSGNAQEKNAEEDADELDVEAHVAVENVAELVGDDALQFVAVEPGERPARDGYRRVAQFQSGGKGVDVGFGIQDKDLRDWDARGDGHFLHHVDQTAFGRIRCFGVDPAGAQHFRHGAAAFFQSVHLVDAGGQDHDDNGHGHEDEKRGIEKREGGKPLVVVVGFAGVEGGVGVCADIQVPGQADGQGRHQHNYGHGEEKRDELPPAVFAGPGLPGKEVGRTVGVHAFRQEKDTLGAVRSSGFSTASRRAAALKSNADAITFWGNFSR